MERALRRDLRCGALLGLGIGVVSMAGFRIWLAASASVLTMAAAASVLARPNRWMAAFVASALLLPPLPLPWGDSGVHPALLFALLGLWAGVLRAPAWRVYWSPLACALSLLAAALLASVPWAAYYSGPRVAAGSLARVGLFGISIYLFFYLAYGPGRGYDAKSFLRLLFWAGTASAAFAVFDFMFQLPAPARFAQQFVWLTGGVFRRAQGVFYEASTLASLCVFLLVLLAAIAVLRMARPLGLHPLWLFGAAALLIAALIFSFSRGAVANLLVATAVLVCLERKHLRANLKIVRLGAVVAVCLMAGAGAVLWLFPELLRAYAMKLQHTVEFFLADPNTVLSQRLDAWGSLIGQLREDPALSLLGIGYKTLPYTERFGGPVVADNMYLSLLVETGWPGLAALILLNAAILRQAYRQARSAQSAIIRLCGTCAFSFWCGEMVQMATGDILTYWRILPAFFALLAFGARDDGSVPGPVQ